VVLWCVRHLRRMRPYSSLPNAISQTRRGAAPALSVMIWIGSGFISSSGR
jgi:hypothetical protein